MQYVQGHSSDLWVYQQCWCDLTAFYVHMMSAAKGFWNCKGMTDNQCHITFADQACKIHLQNLHNNSDPHLHSYSQVDSTCGVWCSVLTSWLVKKCVAPCFVWWIAYERVKIGSQNLKNSLRLRGRSNSLFILPFGVLFLTLPQFPQERNSSSMRPTLHTGVPIWEPDDHERVTRGFTKEQFILKALRLLGDIIWNIQNSRSDQVARYSRMQIFDLDSGRVISVGYFKWNIFHKIFSAY